MDGRDCALLDQLLTEKRDSFALRQDVQVKLDGLWFERSSLVDAARIAYNRMKCEYATSRKAWDLYVQVRQTNGPLINLYEKQWRDAIERMNLASLGAQRAYNLRDHIAAKDFKSEKEEHATQRDEYNAERIRLMAEIQSARVDSEETHKTYQQVKAEFKHAKEQYFSVCAEYDRTQEELQLACSAFGESTEALSCYIRQMCKGNDTELVVQVGLPLEHRDWCWTQLMPDGTVNFYFGGIGLPDGDGHGHYVLRPGGKAYHFRDPSVLTATQIPAKPAVFNAGRD